MGAAVKGAPGIVGNKAGCAAGWAGRNDVVRNAHVADGRSSDDAVEGRTLNGVVNAVCMIDDDLPTELNRPLPIR